MGQTKAGFLFDQLNQNYANLRSSITEISRNSSANQDFVICSESAFNYDKFCKQFWPDEGKKWLPKSPDALFYLEAEDTLCFVEFKRGKSKDQKECIRAKIQDGLLILFLYAKSIGLSRFDFLNLKIHYTLISYVERTESFTGAQDLQWFKHRVKTMEGLLLEKTHLFCKPEKILEELKKVSNGNIASIDYCQNGNTYS